MCEKQDGGCTYLKRKPINQKVKDVYTQNIPPKLKAPLGILRYNLNFEFEDDYPAKIHPDFVRDMIKLYSHEGYVVWDGCCGSGVIPRIANKMDRVGYGTDVNPKAIELSQKHDHNFKVNYNVIPVFLWENENDFFCYLLHNFYYNF